VAVSVTREEGLGLPHDDLATRPGREQVLGRARAEATRQPGRSRGRVFGIDLDEGSGGGHGRKVRMAVKAPFEEPEKPGFE
jgi:hypothetical protein